MTAEATPGTVLFEQRDCDSQYQPTSQPLACCGQPGGADQLQRHQREIAIQVQRPRLAGRIGADGAPRRRLPVADSVDTGLVHNCFRSSHHFSPFNQCSDSVKSSGGLRTRMNGGKPGASCTGSMLAAGDATRPGSQ